jgi:hypothetical protein
VFAIQAFLLTIFLRKSSEIFSNTQGLKCKERVPFSTSHCNVRGTDVMCYFMITSNMAFCVAELEGVLGNKSLY